MVRLVIIADDFTGALDTGVKLAEEGISTKVVLKDGFSVDSLNEDCDVLVISSETRHLPAADAYRTVFNLVKMACTKPDIGLYKKTDSMLRGNIGSELAAVLEASGKESVAFIPALPKQNRVTINGKQYADGKPIDEADGCDEYFESMHSSDITEIIASQTALPVRIVKKADYDEGLAKSEAKEIVVYDAETDEDIQRIAANLKHQANRLVFAGCAGFAEMLSFLYSLKGNVKGTQTITETVALICGSVHPTSQKQLTVAETAGIPRFTLTAKEVLDGQDKVDSLIRKMIDILPEAKGILIDANDLVPNEKINFAKANGIEGAKMRSVISSKLGLIGKKILEKKPETLITFIGGDTMAGFIDQMQVQSIIPEYEVLPGCVMSRIICGNNSFHIMSKSGGFGDSQWMKTVIKGGTNSCGLIEKQSS